MQTREKTRDGKPVDNALTINDAATTIDENVHDKYYERSERQMFNHKMVERGH